MRKRNGLKSVQTLAKSAEVETSSQVSSHRRALQIEEQRLAQLEAYHREYTRQGDDAQQTIGINSIRSHRGFMQKLNEAIAAQRKAVSHSLMQLETQLGLWREARSHALSLQKFSERVAEKADKRQERKDQKELDNIARHQTDR